MLGKPEGVCEKGEDKMRIFGGDSTGYEAEDIEVDTGDYFWNCTFHFIGCPKAFAH